MKKKALTITTVLTLMLTLVFTSALASFAAGGEHTHTWSEWTTAEEPTYVHDGVMVRTCTSCGAQETLPAPRIPSYSTWLSENGNLYYTGSDGQLYIGWHRMKPYQSKKIKWCFFNESGVYAGSVKQNTKNKWVSAGGYRFYFNKKKRPVGPGFNFIKGKLYYMNALGAVTYGTFVAGDGNTYTANSKGQISGLAYYKYKYKTFIYIDISDQTLTYYKKGKVVMTADVVTGRRGATDTPTGSFKLRKKRKGIILRGPTWSNYVNYWMAFKGSSYGMHDATWRSSAEFSNHKTYIKNGSHGCVNMRYEDAKALYKKAKKGTRVIIQQ